MAGRRKVWLSVLSAAVGLVLVGAVVISWQMSEPANAAAARAVDIATTELADTGRAHEVDGCNFYSGQARGPATGCPGGWNRGQWCADFARYVWRSAGVAHAEDLDNWARSGRQYGERYGTWHPADSGYTPRPGDLIVYRDGAFETPDGNSDHIGVVIAAHPGWLSTIEGNVGDGMTDRRRLPRAWHTIEGFASPA